MYNEYTQQIRKKMCRRFERVLDSPFEEIRTALNSTWQFIHSTPQISGIIDMLIVLLPDYEDTALKIIDAPRRESKSYEFTSELEEVVCAYYIIDKCIKYENCELLKKVLKMYRGANDPDLQLPTFKIKYIRPLYNYLDDKLEDDSNLLYLLVKYKQGCEWFRKNSLSLLWSNNTTMGEKLLAYDLYQFLHSHGIKFSIEPSSASGRVDLISEQDTTDKLLVDAKVFNSKKGKSYLLQAINQVYIYTQDFNESVGYLAIFKTDDTDIRLSLTGCAQSIPYININNKIIYLVIIDIYEHPATASKRKVQNFVEINEADILADCKTTTC